MTNLEFNISWKPATGCHYLEITNITRYCNSARPCKYRSEEKYPYKSDYYHLIEGKTISRRGKWWTAVLLVQGIEDANKRVLILQRWQKRNRGRRRR